MVDNKRNRIYLIGMMASGKSTVGKLLAESLEMDFVDMDEEIVSIEKMSVNKIFESKGEDYFRRVESTILKNLSKRNNLVISTGGGAPIYHNGIDIMKESAKVIWLKVSKETIYKRLSSDTKRPLARKISKFQLAKMATTRNAVYKQADIRVWNRGAVDDVIHRIINQL